MSYRVKEIVKTIQGEGANTGKVVVLCRFEGCNLNCCFCDESNFAGIDGSGGGEFETPDLLAEAILELWGKGGSNRMVVLTGGEPLLQVDTELITVLHERSFYIAVETNGSLTPPDGLDWICVSPKPESSFVLKSGNELKLVYPQQNLDPSVYLEYDFEHFFLQPVDSPDYEDNLKATLDYCLKHPQWRVSLQTHKYMNIP